MAVVQPPSRAFTEIAEFIASGPNWDQLLSFRPSEPLQQRARELLTKLREGRLSDEESEELDQFGHAETLMRLIKARIHARQASQP